MDTHTTTSASRPHRTRRLLTAAVALLVALTGLGLTGSPAGAAPGAPTIIAHPGYDLEGPNGYVRLIWGQPLATTGGAIDTWAVEVWNADASLKEAGYHVDAEDGPLQHLVIPDATVKKVRIRARNADGWGPFTAYQGIQVLPGSTPHRPFATKADLVERQYQDLLGRQPTANELAAGLNGTFARHVEELIEDLATRVERDAIPRYQAIRLYLAYFDRAPDAAGLAHWEGQLRSGAMSLKAVSAFFAKSAEFKAKYAGLSNEDFVELIYQNVLDRSAVGDPGAEFWTHELDSGNRTRGDVMVGFSESAEGRKLRRGDAVTADLWLAMVKTPLSKGNMAAYARHILAGGNTGTLGITFLHLNAYQP